MGRTIPERRTSEWIDTDSRTHLLELPTKGYIFLDFSFVFLSEFLQIIAKGFELFRKLNPTNTKV